jgi:hypothetical protein
MVSEETTLIDGAVAQLREMLPANWTVEPSTQAFLGASTGDESQARTLADSAIELRAPRGVSTTFAVEARRSFDPRTAERLLAGLTGVMRSIAGGYVQILAVAPWMSARTQELLAREGINYVDLTGNARIQLDNPTLFIKSTGATRNPQPAPRGRAGVGGRRAARLIRLLIDVQPPYRVSDIAAATGLAPGYVSRLLDTLDREAVVERSRRGPIEAVDIKGLMRMWTGSYDVFKSNEAATFLAPKGVQQVLSQLAELTNAAPVAITGSFAAVRLAPVAAPALLVAYADDISAVAETLGLLPADEGANVVLLRPFDPVVWERTDEDAGLRYVAPSQAAADCLTGNGRMPAEGEALLAWMVDNQSRWRIPPISDMSSFKGAK